MNPPLRSKINTAAIVISLATLVITNIGISPENQIELLKLVGLGVPPLIVVFRTWFTKKKDKL